MKYTHLFTAALTIALLSFFTSSCAAAGAGGQPFDLGVVGSVTAASDQAQSKPALLVRYDGDIFVAWAQGAAEAALFWRQSDPRAYAVPPRVITGGRVIVRVRSHDVTWEGGFDDRLPVLCRPVFSQQEIDDWGIEFALVPEP